MKNEKLIVRRGNESDLEWLTENNIALARESESLELDPHTVRSGVAAVLSDRSLGFYLLAEFEEKRSGQLMVTTEWSDWRCGCCWWLQSVYVRPQYRGRGVFRRLFEAVLTLGEEAGNVVSLRLYVDRFNHAAQASYRKMGMSASHYQIFELPFYP